MRIYHAGRVTAGLYATAGLRRALVTYANAGKPVFDFWTGAARHADGDVFLDSGAFSAHMHGKVISLREYCDWLHMHAPRVSAYANLDVIGDWRATAVNQAAMEAEGLRPVPTFHRGSPWTELERLAATHDYIALGGMVSAAGGREAPTQARLTPYLDACWRRAGRGVESGGGVVMTVKTRALLIPADWPRTRIRLGQSWNGSCRSCGRPGELGHLVRWDPHSGKPSKWQHVSCSDPYGATSGEASGRLF